MIPKNKSKISEVHTVDAAGRVPGRLATEIAHLLQGKHRVDYAPNLDMDITVKVSNVKNMRLTGNKLNQKVYRHNTGYPGGLRTVGLKVLMKERPHVVLTKAVNKMLPKNRLRNPRMRRIIFI
ncbi:MAG: 50S ribosomal protein L13 [Patescibacteria group bacterium]|jgi:large subunit ribosomal protein L13